MVAVPMRPALPVRPAGLKTLLPAARPSAAVKAVDPAAVQFGKGSSAAAVPIELGEAGRTQAPEELAALLPISAAAAPLATIQPLFETSEGLETPIQLM